MDMAERMRPLFEDDQVFVAEMPARGESRQTCAEDEIHASERLLEMGKIRRMGRDAHQLTVAVWGGAQIEPASGAEPLPPLRGKIRQAPRNARCRVKDRRRASRQPCRSDNVKEMPADRFDWDEVS